VGKACNVAAPLPASTDMGNISHVIPTIHPMLGIDSLPAVNHQPEFAAHTITEATDRAIVDGARLDHRRRRHGRRIPGSPDTASAVTAG
jgi:hypothetical protein